jgi:NADH-quinone oxidoreductase subunit F
MSVPERTPRSTCWTAATEPSPELLAKLPAGPLSGKASADLLRERIALLRRDRVTKPTLFVGTGTCGLGAGAAKTVAAAKTYLAEKAIDAEVVEVGCLGMCSEEPLLDVQLPGRARLCFARVTAERVPAVLDAALSGQASEKTTLGQFRAKVAEPWPGVAFLDQHPFFAPQLRWVLANSGIVDPGNLDEYIARGGYTALEKTLRTRKPEAVCEEVIRGGLRGRGGGGFPAGRKWKLAREAPGDHKYLICNADEGDPGAFMDRAVAESDPYRLLEGMVIAAYAIGASKAYIYIRAEYPLAIERLKAAIPMATAYGLLGKNILGSGFDLEIMLKLGAGAFVCGEETALMHSIEGKRGMPRPRPPFPVTAGLFGMPTVINNVETLACVPGLMAMGDEAFAAVGTAKSKGTKVFALSGMVNRTGLVEVPMGTTIRDIVFAVGGGIPNGKRCKGVQIGGPSGGCIPEPKMDITVDYDALKELGAIMGSGGLVVLDENTCMVDLAKFFMEFIQAESCGKCIPCREGTKRMLEILQAITRPRRRENGADALVRFQGVMQLKQLAETIRISSLCGLGQTAPNPVLSTMRWFHDEYEAHVYDRACPAGTCKELVGAPCQAGCPVGTEVWRYVAHLARGETELAYRAIREANPFPSVCARVCSHPCEEVCRCGATGGEPIAVRALKRYVVDHVDPKTFAVTIKPATERSKRVAVIGAGPSGLTVAHYLSQKGHRVTMFEKENQPGGMLMNGIPAYRLPREVLEKEIATLLNDNIELKCNVALGKDITIDGLLAAGFHAVYVSIGAYRSQRLGIEGEDVAGVIPGMAFLKANNLRNEALARGQVGIVGGGNTAMDAARVALRQPGVESVTILYRRTRDEMPAFTEEVHAALDEGITIKELVAPLAVLSRNGKLTGVRLIRNELGAQDSSGRPRPVPVKGSEFELPLDTLVVAISETPEAEAFSGLRTTRWGTIETNPESLGAGKPGVFSGGDVARGPTGVIEAIADGKRAALMIDRYLGGKQLKMIKKVRLPSLFIEPLADAGDEAGEADAANDPKMARAEEEMVPVAKRRGNFVEVELGLSLQAATDEARRCLRCDLDFTRPV